MPQKFKNMDELVNYLNELEKRVTALEDEELPDTDLFSNSFIKRSLAIWGHLFTAQIMIRTIIIILSLAIMFAVVKKSDRDILNIPGFEIKSTSTPYRILEDN